MWPSRSFRVTTVRGGLAAVLLGSVACSPSSLVDVQSPSTVVDPSTVNTVTGAIALRTAVLTQLMYTETATYGDGVIGASGALTDELNCVGCSSPEIDVRQPTDGQVYSNIHAVRIKAQIAREALLAYAADAPSAPRAWQGELYAVEGYMVLWLAELYCTGVPLTSVPLQGTPVPTRGFTTQELFTRASALFDSAAVLGQDSAAYVNLARVGKGRALLGLGAFAAADSAVAAVPTDFVYKIRSDSSGTTLGYNQFPVLISAYYYRALDHEGDNGLVWSTDPRTGVVPWPGEGDDFGVPAKYNVTAGGVLNPTTYTWGVPVRLADGLEARLIQAEAALARGDASWLTTLNTLRGTCVGTTSCAPVPGLTSTSLSPLTDPGTDTGRVSLVMQERAMWLYLTGHREGDLRRLVTLYHRDPGTLWPTGVYSSPYFPDLGAGGNYYDGTPYGTAAVFPVPATEQANNPLYSGCYNLNP